MTMPPLRAATLFVLAIWPGLAAAANAEPKSPPDAAAAAPAKPVQSEAQQYCQNIAGAATDARFARQAKQLSELQGQLKQRIDQLEAKQAELKDVLARHDEAMKRAQESLVGIYSHMRPDAAASQLSALDDVTAAAVLAQLKPRVSSAILDEVAPDRAVKLINAIAGAVSLDGKKS